MIKVLMIATFLLLLFFLFAYGMYRAVSSCWPHMVHIWGICLQSRAWYTVKRRGIRTGSGDQTDGTG